MPTWLICVPLAVQWIALGVRYRSFTLPSAANPFITAGGLVGEGKLEYLEGMGPLARAATARYCAFCVDETASPVRLRRALRAADLKFPIVVKPNLGMCGYGVRRVDDLDQLRRYLAGFPRGETVVLQEYLSFEGEAGIFYARDPRDGKGRLIGLALRHFPRVTGDGIRSVGELIAADVRARRVIATSRHQAAADLGRIPGAGEMVRLSTVGSTRVGGLYLDGHGSITPELTAAIDRIARDMPEFHFGRFDVRFTNLSELSEGGGFKIMEVNGAGSEAIQAWDPGTGLLRALRIIFAKQRMLFAIGAAQRSAGVVPIGLRALLRLHLRQQRLNACYPASN